MRVRTDDGKVGWVDACTGWLLARRWREQGEAGSVAAFLRPPAGAPPCREVGAATGILQDEDEVRVAAAEGRLAGEFNRYPMLAAPGNSAVFLRSWTDKDE